MGDYEVRAGADGIFLSVRGDWVDTPETLGLYDRLVRPMDHAILAAVGRAHFNMLQVCGRGQASASSPATRWR